ncbi:MAG: TonB-dependent receptor [Pseudomonadota bacterium]
MHKKKHWSNGRSLCVSLILALPFWGHIAIAQEPPALEQTKHIDILAQPLGEALVAISDAFGVSVLAEEATVSGKQAPAVRGMLSISQALDRVLGDSGLTARLSVSGAFIVERVDPDSQEKPSSPPGTATPIVVEEIVVRGELRSRSLQDSQTSVFVVPGEVLDNAVDKDLFDVIDRIPGVTSQGGFTIRGLASRGVGGGSAPTVNIQVDGSVIPNVSTAPFSTWDVEQVEILRGPQSNQQGPSSLAGAVVLNTRDPQFDDLEVKLRGDFGSFDESRGAIAVNVPVSDVFAVRFAFDDFRSDGDISNRFTGEDSAKESRETLRGKIRFRPSSSFDAILSYTRSDTREGQQSVNGDAFPSTRVSDSIGNVGGISHSYNLRLDLQFNENWSVTSESTYLLSDYVLDAPLIEENPDSTPARRTIDQTTKSQEIKVLYDNDNLRGTTGVYYLDRSGDTDFAATTPDISRFIPLPPGLPTISAVVGNTLDDDIENYAIFGEIEFNLSERWVVTAGFRWDSQEQESTSSQFSVFTPDLLNLNASGELETLESDFNAFLPKASLVYRFNDELSVSLTGQRAYRAGGAAIDLIGNPYSFDPEFSNNLELALRSTFASGKGLFNANFFYTDYTDMQVQVPGPSGQFFDAQIDNAGAATIWGAEIQSEYQFSETLSAYANVGYSNTRFDDYVIVQNNQPVDLEGNRFPRAPEWTGAVGAEITFDNGFFADLSINYTESAFFSVQNLSGELSDSFTLVNARFGYQSKSFWSVAVYARNLFDEQYLFSRRVDADSNEAGDSRVIGVTLRANL